jgi:hypothetical protein
MAKMDYDTEDDGESGADDGQAQADADTLLHAHEIRSDKGRHSKALSALGNKANAHRQAAATERKSFRRHVKSGLDNIKAGKPPFEEAAAEQDTPETEAAGE